MTSEMKQQYTIKITQANKTQLIVILYEMTQIYLEEAKEAHSCDNRPEFRNAIRKTRGCINELMSSLNFEYEISMKLLQLYLYVNRELARADVRNQETPIDNSLHVINGLHSAYLQISEQDVSTPIMVNTQTVYAGLTYGKNDLTENLTNQGTNRGFRA